MKKIYHFNHTGARQRAASECLTAPDGYRCTIEPAKRSLDQNAIFHAICSEVSKKAEWMGRKLEPDQWKVLFVSGHSIATKQGGDIVPGIEGEFVSLRESTAKMSKARATSLIEYTMAWCADKGIEV